MVFYVPRHGTLYSIGTFVIGAISIMIIIVLGLVNFMEPEGEIVPFDHMVQEEIVPKIHEMNVQKFLSRGLEWYS